MNAEEQDDLRDLFGDSPSSTPTKTVRRVNLRKRLRAWAEAHGNTIVIDKFIREQIDLADLGVAEEVDLRHVRQTLCRFPEFKKNGEGVYVYLPQVFKKLEDKRRAAYAGGNNSPKKRQEKLDLESLFG